MRRGVWVTAILACLSSSAVAQTVYPFTLDNCGMAVDLQAPPQRIVAIKSSAFELLLALGAQDRVVGAAFLDGAVPERWASAAAAIPLISDGLPSQEAVLAYEPDFIFGGWESNFAAEGAGERPALDAIGVASYVAPAACRSVAPVKLTFDALFGHIAELGELLDMADAAKMLVEEQAAALSAVTPDTRGLTALWYSSGTRTPYVGADGNAPAMIMDALGVQNIMRDVADGWVSASWEAIAAADPDVIVLVDAVWNSAEQKRTLLAGDPVTSQMTAVRNGHYLIVPFAASEAGVRTVDALTDLAEQLAALAIEP
jgi:iron complex transport system substrate-binding protein